MILLRSVFVPADSPRRIDIALVAALERFCRARHQSRARSRAGLLMKATSDFPRAKTPRPRGRPRGEWQSDVLGPHTKHIGPLPIS